MQRTVIGIDEVGRGALAGPVVVAAAMVAGPASRILNPSLGILKDSKKLTPKQRELWYNHFAKHPQVSFAFARVYPRGIERMNISQAANLAASRACGRVMRDAKGQAGAKGIPIFLDGGLYLANKKHQADHVTSAKTLVKADENIVAVKIASIVAKVHRDRFMQKLARQYPEYGFAVHKGYGTKVHLAAVQRFGPCDVHRLTFLKAKYRI